MPKYDAFGREIGEDTLAGLGTTSEASAEPAPAPATAPRRPEPAPVRQLELGSAGAPAVRVRRGGGLGCFIALVVLIAAIAAPIVLLVGVARDSEDTFDGLTTIFESGTDEPAVPEPPAEPAQPPSGLTGASLVARGNFGRALRQLDQARLGRIAFIRLAPDRVDAQLVKGSRQRSAQVDFEGELTRGSATPGASGLGTIAISDIDSSAPARLVRGSARRYKSVREQGINYLVLTPIAGEGHHWVAYFKNGVYVEGDRRGRVVRRIS